MTSLKNLKRSAIERDIRQISKKPFIVPIKLESQFTAEEIEITADLIINEQKAFFGIQ